MTYRGIPTGCSKGLWVEIHRPYVPYWGFLYALSLITARVAKRVKVLFSQPSVCSTVGLGLPSFIYLYLGRPP